MKCPSCNHSLEILIKDCFVCPNGDGALITSGHLLDKDEQVVDRLDPVPVKAKLPSRKRNHEIPCPHCTTKMHHVDYSSTGIIIDSCLKCHYRWLDQGELRKIKDHNPQISPKDAAMLLSIEEKIGKVWQEKEVNPSYRLNNRSTFGSPGALGLTAIYAIFIGLRHSKFMRVATIFIIIVTALIYYYVIQEF